MKTNKILILMLSSLLLLLSCKGDSVKLKKSQNNSNNTPVMVEKDIVVYGQINTRNAFPYNNYPTKNSLNNPMSVIKVGSYFYVSEVKNNRILIFKDEIGGDPVGIIGQDDFTSSSYNRGIALDNKGLFYPYQLATNGTNLMVADRYNHRVLIWNTAPKGINDQPADVVIGQTNFNKGEVNQGLSAPTANTLYYPRGIVYAGGKLYIVDSSNNRVLIYNSIPVANNRAADAVIGQDDFISNTAHGDNVAGPNDFDLPMFINSDGTKLFISDYNADRVLVWNTLPTGNTPADVVIGQPDFTTVGGDAATQSSLNGPMSVLTVGANVYVSDYQNSRIVLFSSLPTSGAAGNADGVIGQADFVSGGSNRGVLGGLPTALTLNNPSQSFHDGTNLIVLDTSNHRILKYPSSLAMTEMGVTAPESLLFGKTSYTSMDINLGASVSASGFSNPRSIAVTEEYVVVSDQVSCRVLVYDKFAVSNGSDALAVIGQPDFTSTDINQGNAGPSANTLKLSEGALAIDSDGRLYIVDSGNHRILVYNSVPTTNNASADFVIGQADFVTATNARTQNTLRNPHSVYARNDKLFVADMGNHRVLIYDLPITSNQPDAQVVLGQPDFTTGTAGTTASTMKSPWGVYAGEDGKLYVNGMGNNRVLVFNSIPTNNGVAADVILGQVDDVTVVNNVMSQSTFYKSIHSTVNAEMNGHILIPDPYGLRILAFDIDNLATGMNAKYHWGQDDFESYIYHLLGTEDGSYNNFAGVSAIVNDPYDDYIWTAERYTNRVLRIKKDHFWGRKLDY